MLKDLASQIFNRLTVIRRVANGNCGQVRWLCRCVCGKEKIIEGQTLREGHTKICGCLNKELIRSMARRGAGHPKWKGGRGKTKKGYVWLRNAEAPGRHVRTIAFEHVVVMERYLGRSLYKGETVHHKNGVRDDNRLENLELWAANHSTGQRVTDLVIWAKQLLAKYEPPGFKVE